MICFLYWNIVCIFAKENLLLTRDSQSGVGYLLTFLRMEIGKRLGSGRKVHELCTFLASYKYDTVWRIPTGDFGRHVTSLTSFRWK